ncbi:HlyC/CorC family transporter [Mycolicibacterium sp. CH28]|uniref:hemolysin family protein n=1 Tax=Mycolicibacterium sp. CH28 TaxID=2512237 RepID=UPI00108121DF|nr:hemolysin family protein [Mycolicibacterium sp. CH28]TGD89637.1 HlyC/CorC family transporter [Mycolicibacterium sp. CH28]
MRGYWFDVSLIAVLMVVNGILAGSEITLISLREGQLKAMERRGTRRAHTVVRLARDPNRFLGTIQLGITLAGYLASATAAVTLALPVVAALRGVLGQAAEPAGIAVVTFVLTAVNLVVGELTPKRLGMQYSQVWSLAVARPLNFLAMVSRPLTWLLGEATDILVRLLGGNPDAGREQLSPQELRELVIGHPGLSAEQRTIITGALEIRERSLREVLVPRRAVVTLPDDMDVTAARTELAQAGHSRAPVVRAHDLDYPIGVVHLRDLLGEDGTVGAVARPTFDLPESLQVSEALRRFKSERQQFALVIDERGGVAGIVTLEDVLEEIVGEIYDETDRDILAVRNMPDGSIVVPGSFPIHDLPDINVEIFNVRGDYTTIAGLVLARLGRIPTTGGDRVDIPNWTIEVTNVADHAITEVRLIPVAAHQHDSAADADPPGAEPAG